MNINRRLTRAGRTKKKHLVHEAEGVASGMALGAAVGSAAGPPGMVAGAIMQATGRSKSASETAAGFLLALTMAFVFMYLILAAQFESWLYPAIILVSLPLTVPFAFMSLKVFGGSLNMFSMLGLLVLFGVVKKNGILQVAHANHLRSLGMDRFTSLMEANRDRLRPILMTTIAFVAGMAPLILSKGIGSGFNRATASIVIGGQTLSLLLTLLAVPVFHSVVDGVRDLGAKLRGKRTKLDLGEGELAAALAEHDPPTAPTPAE
jgi:HAE1 family hydrophobic/amphiphilic exporter-1